MWVGQEGSGHSSLPDLRHTASAVKLAVEEGAGAWRSVSCFVLGVMAYCILPGSWVFIQVL